MHPTSSAPRLLTLLVVVVLLLGSVHAPAGAEPVGGVPTGADGSEAEPAPPGRAFPDVPDVDLSSLGHTGAPLDGSIIERMAAPLPDEAEARVIEIVQRLDLAPPQLASLVEAEAILGDVAAEAEVAAEHARAAARFDAQRADAAGQRLAEARARLHARRTALTEQRALMAEVAVAAYVRPPDADALSRVIGAAATTTDDLTAGVLFSAKADHDGTVRDTLEVAQALAHEQLRSATDVVSIAKQRVEASTEVLEAAEHRRGAFQAALAQVTDARSLLEGQLPFLREDLDRSVLEAWGSLEGLADIGPFGVPVVDVQGIKVHAAIAPRLAALLAAAHADGVPLGGWGYRSIEQQIGLRQSHCGPSMQDVYLKPAAMCSPPTARPGASMHERGLAVDFHLDGRSISNHDSPGYQWLAANAHVYGLYNLPSEPWHWSINGR